MAEGETGAHGAVMEKLDEALTASDEQTKDFQIRQAQQIIVGIEGRSDPGADDEI
jgi:hypothetical protein